jgi:DNA-binding LytR/AlgR family response regulator
MNALFVREDRCYQKIDLDSIRYIEAAESYSRIVTDQKIWVILVSLSQLGEDLPWQDFCRIHRRYLVNTTRITSFDMHNVRLGELELPIGRAYFRSFFAQMPVVGQNNGKDGQAKRRRRKAVAATKTATGQ